MNEHTLKKTIGLLLVHGVGEKHDKQLNHFENEIHKRVTNTEVVVEKAIWHGVIQPREDNFLSKITNNGVVNLDFTGLRRFIINSFGDSVAYQGVKNNSNTYNVYKDIHEVIRTSISNLKSKLPEKALLVIVASSLGAEIISNYIWDIQKEQKTNNNPKIEFEALDTLIGLFTIGCNIPLFTLGLDDDQIIPIQFPPKKLPDYLKEKAKWINIFDRDDVLGYPLKYTSSKYHNLKHLEDKQYNIGGIAVSWNPGSHLKYWQDSDVHKEIAEFIDNL